MLVMSTHMGCLHDKDIRTCYIALLPSMQFHLVFVVSAFGIDGQTGLLAIEYGPLRYSSLQHTVHNIYPVHQWIF